jgi:hypothetical protein
MAARPQWSPPALEEDERGRLSLLKDQMRTYLKQVEAGSSRSTSAALSTQQLEEANEWLEPADFWRVMDHLRDAGLRSARGRRHRVDDALRVMDALLACTMGGEMPPPRPASVAAIKVPPRMRGDTEEARINCQRVECRHGRGCRGNLVDEHGGGVLKLSLFHHKARRGRSRERIEGGGGLRASFHI